ncbi:MAG: hypothetical protein FWG49_07210 [Leptospirales bacterium]|nr:hypothetical protein [Leptospirales bacterium]
MIFYLAILLILCGFLIVISALFIEISEAKETIQTTGHANFKSDNSEVVFSDELDNRDSIFREFEDTLPDMDDEEQAFGSDNYIADEIYIEDDIDDTEPDSPKQKSKAVYAVMFDDRSDIIDYTSGVGTIDPTFLKYKDIKRIGKGIIESDHDGINFYLDEKLYRFDLHRVYDIWCGENYVALPLKGSGIVKLFIIENSPDFPNKVEADFKEFQRILSAS